MKKLLFFFVIAMICINAISCKKKSDGSTIVNLNVLILAEWQLQYIVSDTNGNHNFDSAEVATYTFGTKTMTFTNDGKMRDSAIYSPTSTPLVHLYSYTILPGNVLQTKSLDSGTYYGSTYNYAIAHIDAQGMKLVDTMASPHALYGYSKK